MNYLSSPNPHSIFLNPTDDDEVRRTISCLKNAAPGMDGYTLKIIKVIHNMIIPSIRHIVNLSFETGIVPSRLKTARCKPLFKTDNPHLFTNYRPISILPIVSKLFEKLMHKRLYSFLQKHNLLYIHINLDLDLITRRN